MLVPYEFNKCIVCLKSETGDPEHVIPQVIGGRLSARLFAINAITVSNRKLSLD